MSFAAVAWLLGICFLEETLPASERKGCGRTQARERRLLQSVAEEDSKMPPRTKVAIAFLLCYSLLSGYYAAWQQDMPGYVW